MRKTIYLAAALLAVVLLISLVAAAERMKVTDIKGIVSGELIVEPTSELNPTPIGLGGYPTGFAFAPGRAELAYSAIEEKAGRLSCILHIVNIEKLWPSLEEMWQHYEDRPDRKDRFDGTFMDAPPFSQRERELLRLELKRSGDYFQSQFIEGPISWSPDGMKLAVFAVKESPSHQYSQRDVWVIDYANGKRLALTENSWVTEAAWSPDSKWLAFVAEPADNKAAKSAAKPTQSGLWLVDMTTGARRRIAAGGLNLEWLPDSLRLKFRKSGGPNDGRMYDLNSKQIAPTKPSPVIEIPWYLSPDGCYVANLVEGEGGRRLVVRERRTNELCVNLPAQEFAGWQANSRLLAYFDNNGALNMTTVEGPHRNRPYKVGARAEINPIPMHPAIQWSGLLTNRFMQEEAQIMGRLGVGPSYLAFISGNQLRLLVMAHRKPTTHELAALGRLTQKTERIYVLSQMKNLNLALLMYADDYDNKFPPAGNRVGNKIRMIEDIISPYVPNRDLFDRPGYPGQSVFRYLIEGLEMSKITEPGNTPVAIFDYLSDVVIVGFADGHAKWMSKEDYEETLRSAMADNPNLNYNIPNQ
jgi:hypothetical protein